MANKESSSTITISTHILDITKGLPAKNVDVTIFHSNNGINWILLNRAATNADGRCSQLAHIEDSGFYKLHFNVKPYFEEYDVKSLYPFIEIIIECVKGERYHVPLLLSPFGYSTYRGS